MTHVYYEHLLNMVLINLKEYLHNFIFALYIIINNVNPYNYSTK